MTSVSASSVTELSADDRWPFRATGLDGFNSIVQLTDAAPARATGFILAIHSFPKLPTRIGTGR
jgi:hypothetical protein